MPTPNKDRIRLLVKALRSGHYLKAPGYLHRLDMNLEPPEGILPGGFCCLGVGAYVAMENGLALDRPVRFGGAEPEVCEVIEGSPSYMSGGVAEWYGFPVVALSGGYDVTLLQPDGNPVRASAWNDNEDSTFEDIAKGFEKTFLED